MPYIKKLSKQVKQSFNKEDRQKIYQSTRWKKLRLAKLLTSPLCEICLKDGIITPAEDVHHIDSFMDYSGSKRLEKAYNPSNLMSICKECHGKIHCK